MKKLLIVDDSNIIRSRIMRIIGQVGNDIEIIGAAKNGIEAINIAKKSKPHIVTMDLTMPELDGIGCIKELIKMDNTVRILVVSAISDKSTALEALKMGAMGFLNKPFSDTQLLDALTEIVIEEE